MTDAPQPGTLREFLDALREGSIPFDTSVLAKSPIALRSGESLAFVCYEVTLKDAFVVVGAQRAAGLLQPELGTARRSSGEC